MQASVYHPYGKSLNEYTNIIQEAIGEAGYPVESLRNNILTVRSRRGAIVNLNWFEDISDKGGALRTVARYLKRSLIITVLICRGEKIVYTVHNTAPHDTHSRMGVALAMRLRRRLCSRAWRVVIHSDATRLVLVRQLGEKRYAGVKDKIKKIPLPSYKFVYPAPTPGFRERCGIPNDRMLILFCGLIRPYKNVELIIQTAAALEAELPDAVFLITGKSPDEEYEKRIERLCAGHRNVRLRLGFVPNEDLSSLVSCADVMMLPIDLRSSLNSSSCILSFSFGTNVICPDNGTIREYPEGLAYSYTYSSDDEHLDALRQKVLCAYEEWRHDRLRFEERGIALQRITEELGGHDALVGNYKTLYADFR